MNVKQGVVLEITSKEMYFACGVVEAEFARVGIVPTITSGQDSHEDRPVSLHNVGKALDFRTNSLLTDTKQTIYNRIQSVLNPLGFDCILESINKLNEHLHIEYDPKNNESIMK